MQLFHGILSHGWNCLYSSATHNDTCKADGSNTSYTFGANVIMNVASPEKQEGSTVDELFGQADESPEIFNRKNVSEQKRQGPGSIIPG